MIDQFEVRFSLNGKQTVQVVNASNMHDAKKIIEAQYNGSKINFYSVNRVKK